MFAACLMMTVFLIKHSDAQITAWAGKQGAGTTAINFAAATSASSDSTAFSLDEGTTGTLFKVTATGNGTISYTFETNPSDIADSNIAVTTNEGTIALATTSTLDFETKEQYVFKIVASDGGSTTNVGTATITLNVADLVQFTKRTFCLSSSSVAAASTVGTITTDESAVTFAAPGGTDAAKFAVSTSTGAITVAASTTLFFPTQDYYTFTMTATTTTANVTASGTQNIHVVINCGSDSGAGQVAALLSVLLLSVTTALFY